GRHKKILQTAERLFHRKGYVATTVGDIAAKAELSPGTVQNYFGSKGAILVALIDRYDVEFIERQTERLNTIGNSPAEDVIRLLVAIVQDALDRLPAEAWVHALSNSILEVGGEVEKGYADLNSRLYDLLYVPLRRHKEAGNLPDRFDVEAAREMLELINHAMFEQRIGTVPFDMKDYRVRLRSFVDLIVPAKRSVKTKKANTQQSPTRK
ncbi:MAG: TetR/AcrR family transcriptional regulator, partial [Bythopirellula sp.]